VTEPVPISLISGRYLLFDVDAVSYLRKTHYVCGVLSGSIPQVPQQNVFLGLPLELLPEEARLLVEKNAAYIVDSTAWHKETFSTLNGEDRRRYLDSLRTEGVKARRVAEEIARKRQEKGLAKQAQLKAAKEARDAAESEDTGAAMEGARETAQTPSPVADDGNLSSTDAQRTRSPSSASTASRTSAPYTVTPTTTYTTSPIPDQHLMSTLPTVPKSYPLFHLLHSQGYYITPGLRFGCDYTAYPGDPLRFHSHFLAVGYEWDEEIPLIDIISGGRLGTGVKKGFLVGGMEKDGVEEMGTRAFCVEWGGM
jgi:tRNA-splicing endonuclease subunit Sen34